MIDPFTRILKQLWAVVLGEPDVTSLVRAGNRIRRVLLASELSETTKTPKDEITSADLPEIDIVPAGGLVQLPGSSGGAFVQQSFEVQIAVETARLDVGFFPLYWAVLRAFIKADCRLGLDFVEGITLTQYTTDANTMAILRGLEGWSALLGIDVKMRFTKSNIDNE